MLQPAPSRGLQHRKENQLVDHTEFIFLLILAIYVLCLVHHLYRGSSSPLLPILVD